MRVMTESGSVYLFSPNLDYVQRVSAVPLRGDQSWIPVLAVDEIKIGHPVNMLLDLPETPANVHTLRMTTPVVSIERPPA